MLSHYEVLRGLAIISNLRLRKSIDAIQDERAKKASQEDMLHAVRQSVRQEASTDPKARMLWDANRELNLYSWGPMQLFFCVAWAFLGRYRYLRNQHPDLVFADLDRYIEENSAGLEATRNLRD